MKSLNENVIRILKDQIWYIGTYSDEPSVVPVYFREVTSDGKLVIAHVFLRMTLENILNNGKIAIAACDAKTQEGYQIKGTATYLTEGELVDKFKGIVSNVTKNRATAKGVLVITPEQVIVATPSADNNKEL